MPCREKTRCSGCKKQEIRPCAIFPRPSSVAQSLDGKPSDGEPAFPRTHKASSKGPSRQDRPGAYAEQAQSIGELRNPASCGSELTRRVVGPNLAPRGSDLPVRRYAQE